MTIEQMRSTLAAAPFRPFHLHLADGGVLTVRHPELVSFSPGGRTMIVFSEGEAFSIVDLLLVSRIEGSNGVHGRGRKRS